jgi:hypothetical protein
MATFKSAASCAGTCVRTSPHPPPTSALMSASLCPTPEGVSDQRPRTNPLRAISAAGDVVRSR